MGSALALGDFLALEPPMPKHGGCKTSPFAACSVIASDTRLPVMLHVSARINAHVTDHTSKKCLNNEG